MAYIKLYKFRKLFNSVGNGPSPTRVVYAFMTPILVSILFGGTPKPVQTPATPVLDDVTYGYVPKSISNIVAFAPSASRFTLGSLMILLIIETVSTIMLFVRSLSRNSFNAASSFSVSTEKFSFSLKRFRRRLYFSTKVSQFFKSPNLICYLAYLLNIPIRSPVLNAFVE